MIATARPVDDYCNYTTRDQIQNRLYLEAAPAVGPVLEALVQRRFEGLVCILSNPVGDLLRVAHSVYGIPSTQLTSFAPGAERARRLLLQALLVRSHLGNPLSERDPGALLDDERVLEAQHELPGLNPRVQIEVVGGHGAEIPLFDRCTVDGSPLATGRWRDQARARCRAPNAGSQIEWNHRASRTTRSWVSHRSAPEVDPRNQPSSASFGVAR